MVAAVVGKPEELSLYGLKPLKKFTNGNTESVSYSGYFLD
jgi:hypothetical protein